MQTQSGSLRIIHPSVVALASQTSAAPIAVRALHTGPRPLATTSTLTPHKQYLLPMRDRRQSALYFYNNIYTAKRPEWMWMSLISQVLFPELPQRPANALTRKNFMGMFKSFSESWTQLAVVNFIRVKKDSAAQTFEVTVPILAQQVNDMTKGWMAAAAVSSNEKGFIGSEIYNQLQPKFLQAAEITRQTFPLVDMKAEGNLSAKDVAALNAAKGMLTLEKRGDFQLASLTLTFNKSESEFLANSNWLEIRPLDLYGLIQVWVEGYFGMYGRSPNFALPMTRIAAASDSHSATPRTSKEGLVMDEHGVLLAIPEKLNNIALFEEKSMNAMSHPDGSFSRMPPDGVATVEHLAKMPSAMPVYVDWVNLKMTYTSLEGRLQVMNLDRSQPFKITHARKFLDLKVATDRIMNFLTQSVSLAKFLNVAAAAPLDGRGLLKEIGSLGLSEDWGTVSDIPLRAVFELAPKSPMLTAFITAVKATKDFIKSSPANAYARYSVPTIMELQAQMIVFSEFGPRYLEVRIQDETDRAPYLQQDPDPEWKLPGVPFVNEGMGLLPHQFKVQNKLRGRPAHAVIPVDAGGGKTPICVYEVLTELKSSNGDALCMVMCPSHLVAQYVKEFSYFTGSRVNVIPVTTYTLRRQGYARLQAMLQNAPMNTVVVTDYKSIQLGASTLAYGTSPVKSFPVVDFLRQFKFQFVACDESHVTKNSSSSTNKAVARLISQIPAKRMMSGTMVGDRITDLVGQVALMDPSVFGTKEDFIKEYALEVRGTKVIAWKPGAELAVKQLLGQNVVIAEAKRKEWAAILPFPRERFHPVDLSENQLRCYNQLLTQIQDDLRARAEHDEELKKLLSGEDPDNLDLDIDQILHPYLARLEQFITAPGADELGKIQLTGDDLLSPKVRKIVDICRDHLEQNIPGKVLIFSSYLNSAKAIYDAFPPELQSQAIFYTAGEKEECGAEFEKNPDKKIMVGVEFSMNTGLNLQFCSRLIREAAVWTPGALEQGNSRVGRPNIKSKESRPEVFYDWIVANNTIDVTKTSYLMAKTISKAKYDEAGNQRFDDLEVPPLFSMTLDNVFSSNNWEGTLQEYFQAYQSYKQALFAEYDEYRARNKNLLFSADGKLKMESIIRTDNPEGAALMLRVPYVPGTELYQAGNLGLKRYDEFLGLIEEEDAGDEEEGEEDDTADASEALRSERERTKGMFVHTDFGDGEIVGVGRKMIKVRLPSGESIKVRKLAAFIITRANTSNKDLRKQLLKMTGDVPLDAPIDVLEVKIDPAVEKAQRKKMKQVEEEVAADDSVRFELTFTVVNDFLGIRLTNSNDEAAVRAAQAMGFSHFPSYFAAHINQPQRMIRLFKGWQEEGFTMDKASSTACALVYRQFKQNPQLQTWAYGFSNQTQIRNFYRLEFKADPDKMSIHPYPIIQDGQLYIGLPKVGHPGSLNAIRIGQKYAPGAKWQVFETGDELIKFVNDRNQASTVIRSILESGIEITNIEELQAEFKALRQVKRKADAEF